MARAVKELAEEHVEVPEEGLRPVDVGERNAEVAAVFLGPHFKAVDLAVAKTRPQGLAGLQIFVRHRAERNEAVLLGERHVGGPRKVRAEAILEHPHDPVLPIARKTPARAVVGNAEVPVVGFVEDEVDLGVEALQALLVRKIGITVAEVDFVHDREDRNLKEDRMKPRSFDADVDPAGKVVARLDRDVLALEMEKAQELDEVGLHEAKSREVGEFLLPEVETAERIDFRLKFGKEGTQIDAGRSALEAVGHFGRRELMQHALLHRELVEIRVEQGLNDHCPSLIQISQAAAAVGRSPSASS